MDFPRLIHSRPTRADINDAVKVSGRDGQEMQVEFADRTCTYTEESADFTGATAL